MSARDWSAFAAYRNKLNTWIWASAGGGSKKGEGIRWQSDASGNTYFFGTYEGTARFGVTSLFTSTSQQHFVAKLDAQGLVGIPEP